MVESALEFARIARDLDYHDFIFSMKASNPKIMIAAYRLLVARLNQLGSDWNYPLHLGVTEAGEGEDARIKSAIGIGSLLADGIGDTIRVSLTEDSPHEIPVARALVGMLKKKTLNAQRLPPNVQLSYDPYSYQRRASDTLALAGIGDPGQRVKLGGAELIRVVVRQANFDKIAHKIEKMGDYKPEIIYENANIAEVDPRDEAGIAKLNAEGNPQFVTVRDDVDLAVIPAFRLLAKRLQPRHPILLKDVLNCRASVPDAAEKDGVSQKRPTNFLDTLLVASTNIGSLLCDGIGDAILVQGEEAPGQALRLSYNILQAAITNFQNRLCRLPFLRTHFIQFANNNGQNQRDHIASQRGKNRDHGLYRKRARRNGRRRFWLCWRRAGQSESLRRQNASEIQHSRSGSSGPPERLDPRAWQMG